MDYGKQHSEEYRHERFGRDFSSCPLIDRRDENTQLVLIGHSFGGATIRLFTEILRNGAKNEIENTEADDLSPFFLGGSKIKIHSIVAIASPLNGTTAYDMLEDENFDPDGVKAPLWSNLLAKILVKSLIPENDGLVNTISAKAPFGEPQQKLNRKNIRPGVWNIAPVYHGDHMMIHGGLTKTTDVRGLYLKMLTMIDGII